MEFSELLSQMLTLVFIVLAGFIASKAKLMGGDFDRKLSAFIINLTCPCLIAASAMGDVLPRRDMILPLLGVGFFTYFFLFVVASLLPRLYVRDRSLRGMYSFMLMFANVAFMGYPVVASIYGNDSVFYACLLNIPYNITVFIFGLHFVLADTSEIKFNPKVLICPAMIACYVAIIIVALGISNIPSFISSPVRIIGDITVPGSMLLIGSSMAHMKRRQVLGSVPAYVTSFLRLLIIPLSFFFLCGLIGIDRNINLINVTLIAMPVATFGTMFCLRYGKDETPMVQSTVISTVLSVISIPVVTFIMNSF